MKKIWMILLLTTATCVMYAQDLVITAYGDSLKCKITSETNDQLMLTMIDKNGKKKETFISKENIRDIQYNYRAVQNSPILKRNRAQDLIVTIYGDSLQCNILSEDNNQFKLVLFDKKKNKINTFIAKQDVQDIQYNYYAVQSPVAQRRYAQDLIITIYGDSLKCNILSETKEQFILDIFDKKDDRINTFIAKQDVQDIRYNYYAIQNAITQRRYAHDLVVNVYGDSLKCNILSENEAQLTLILFDKKGNKINTFIAKQDVQEVRYNYYAVQNALIQKSYLEQSYLEQNYLEQNAVGIGGRLGFDIGGGCKLGKVAESYRDLENLAEGARFGLTFGLEGAYFFSETWGLGLRYSYFRSSNKEGNNKVTFNNNYIGPSIYVRAPLSNNPNVIFTSSFGGGYMKEKQSVTYRSVDIDMKGHTLGALFSFGFDFKLSPGTAISLELACLVGVLSEGEVTINNITQTVKLPNDQKESLSRIELKIGLKFLPK